MLLVAIHGQPPGAGTVADPWQRLCLPGETDLTKVGRHTAVQ